MRCMLACVLWIAMLLAGLSGPAKADASVNELTLADGGLVRILYVSPPTPRAALVMLPGGNGMVDFAADGTPRRMTENFLVRTLPSWQARGFAVAIPTPPNGMSLLGYRHTPGYAAVLAQVADFVRARVRGPIWLAGISQGAVAAINGGARLGGRVSGLVVLSSVSARSSSGETVFDSEPGAVAVPVLIVANTADTCPASPPGDAARLAAALTSAPRKEVMYMTSSATEGSACEGRSPHSYLGIEEATIDRIAGWLHSAGSR